MPTVSHLLRTKEARVETIEPGVSVLDAANRMNIHHIGSLVVVEGAEPVGIITERDILTRLVARQRDPSSTLVSEIMTERMIFCSPATTSDEVRRIMRDKRIRHMPVIDEGELVGMVSIGDLNQVEMADLSVTVQNLEAYIRQG